MQRLNGRPKVRVARHQGPPAQAAGSSSIMFPRATLAIVMSVLAITVGAGISPSAAAEAVVNRDTFSTPAIVIGLPDDCRPDITGDLSGTDTTKYQTVETSTGFHVTGTTTFSGRIDWSDGTYSIVESVDHFAFATGAHTTVFTNAHEDSGNTYSASGVFLFRLTFHLIEHVTVTAGVVRVEFERGHFHSFGGCDIF